VTSRNKHRFSINVWVGILGVQFLWPNRQTNRRSVLYFFFFLVKDLPEPLEHVPLHHRQHIWFMHDGTPPHFLRIIRQHLNQTFSEQWIGGGGPVNWSARSPGLNPLEFWLWGQLKTLVCSSPINDLEVLQRLENVCQEIRVKQRVFDRVRSSVRRRAESCVEMRGNRTEHLLQRSQEHRPYLNRHWFLYMRWLGFLAHLSEYYTPLKSLTCFFNIL
jgi:hypothetical protein